jgi:hypothetical protein
MNFKKLWLGVKSLFDAQWGINREVKPFVLDSTNAGSWPTDEEGNYLEFDYFIVVEDATFSAFSGNTSSGSATLTELVAGIQIPLKVKQGTTLSAGKIIMYAQPAY